ncbi:hypothetical protein ACIPT4_08235 [Pectobacterium jejuense]|uniref:hypothetical protein n=1 Tax=Pectobacterium jejuense TaxID=2974022 RepID=UPI0037F3C83B
MYIYNTGFYFVTTNDFFQMDISSHAQSFAFSINEFNSVFSPNYMFNHDLNTILGLVEKDIHLDLKIKAYVSKYISVSRSLHKLKAFFEGVNSGGVFYVIPFKKNLSSNFIIEAQSNLKKSPLPAKLKEFMDNYEIGGVESKSLGNKKKKIGESFKAKRVCRFCNNTRHTELTQKGSYKKEAHAISESLGNKKIILNEECDACNEFFSVGIENDIDLYLKFYTTFFKTKTKDNKIPKIKGSNFVYYSCEKELQESIEREYGIKIDHVLMKLPNNNEEIITDENRINFNLDFGKKITYQNIYKALAKFSISVIDTEYVKKLEKTIEWISNKDLFFERLPDVMLLKNFFENYHEPALILYIRKSYDKNLPFLVGQFYFNTMVYVFIVPTFNENIEVDFSELANYENFMNVFEFFFKNGAWERISFNKYIPIKFAPNFNVSDDI